MILTCQTYIPHNRLYLLTKKESTGTIRTVLFPRRSSAGTSTQTGLNKMKKQASNNRKSIHPGLQKESIKKQLAKSTGKDKVILLQQEVKSLAELPRYSPACTLADKIAEVNPEETPWVNSYSA